MSERTARPEREQGCPDGIETCVVHRLVRQGTPEPSEEESLRLVAVRILERNALRDYFDFATLAVRALQPFDRLYPLKNGESALQQLLVQLAHAIPYDAPENDAYWQNVKAACARMAVVLFDRVCDTYSAFRACSRGLGEADKKKPQPSQGRNGTKHITSCYCTSFILGFRLYPQIYPQKYVIGALGSGAMG